MVFLWFSYCFPMVFLLFSYGFPMVFLWLAMENLSSVSPQTRGPRDDPPRMASMIPYHSSTIIRVNTGGPNHL